MAVEQKGELERRAATLRRFRELLVQQRAKFQKYLLVLDHQKGDIETGDVDRLVAHVELEEQIVSEIFTFQKVIDPLEDMLRVAYPGSSEGSGGAFGAVNAEGGHEDLPELKASLLDLRSEVLRRNAENRSLLKQRMETLRTEIAGLRMPMKARRSVYAQSGEASFVDLQG